MSERLGAALPVAAGLCLDCRHLRLATSRRSVFVRCARAAADPSFPRYPPLPVVSCRGYERREGAEAEPPPAGGTGSGPGSQR